MKRLIRKVSSIKINELDEADVKNDRCPNCKNKKLESVNGFKYCRTCGYAYKVFKGEAYIVIEPKGGEKV